YGGHLELWDREMKKCVKRVLPIKNRMVIFSTSDFSQVKAAESAAMGKGGKAGVTAKELRTAAVRMHEAVRRIAGVGVLAFATNAVVRAQFEAIKPVQKA